MIKIYTDGSSTKNRSGWGYVAVMPNRTCNLFYGSEPNATNQQMELLAVYYGLDYWYNNFSETDDVTIYSDSAYVLNCYFEKWYQNWEDNGWYNTRGEPVANKELWEKLLPYFKMPNVLFQKVKGHSGNIYNDLADKLACGAYKGPMSINLTNEKINDTINIKLSELLVEFKMNKLTINDTIDKIIGVFNG